MMLLFFLGYLFSVTVADPALEQLIRFKYGFHGPVGIMTTSNGAKVNINDSTVLTSPLIFNEFFMDSITHFVRERIPERVNHAKGSGAFGYFQVTHNVTDICKANFLSKIGKKTPVAVRFSSTSLDKGGPDTTTTSRGFAVKFYTEDGIFDMVGFNTPMFMIKDPVLFPSQFRSVKRNPATNLQDPNMFWDFITLRPETMFFVMYLCADNGNPDGYRHMPGFSIHTYQIYNNSGQSFFARFMLTPDQGVKNLFAKEAAEIAAKDLDYLVRDLYNAVENGESPSWTVGLQVLTLDDVKSAAFDVFDITKVLPLKKYPMRPIGKLVLNRNPKNHFAEVEQLAFGPYNLVPGILGSPDKLFEARRLAYRDAHIYRLGTNYNKIRVNCPSKKVISYNRDGFPPVDSNDEDAPNYYPNSFNGPIPEKEENRPHLISVTHDCTYNFDQAADMYINEMPDEQKSRMISSIVQSLRTTDKNIQEKAVKIFRQIHEDLGSKVSKGLSETV